MPSSKIKGITVEIGGNTQPLEKALKDVNKTASSLSSELRVIDKLLKLDPTNTTLLAQKQKVLAGAIDATTKKLDILTTAQKQAEEQLKRGEIGQDQYRELERQVLRAKNSLSDLEKQALEVDKAIKEAGNGSKKTAEDMGKVGKAAQESEKQIKTLTAGGVALGTMLGNLATRLVDFAGRAATFLLDAVEASSEFRLDLSRLEQNAITAGTSLDSVSGNLEYFIALTNETDSSVEALSNLLQAGFKDEALTNAVNNLSGAVIKFPDTLKIESLADSLQETLATGTATGQYGELLERLGVNLDEFESGLKKCTTAAEKQEYAINILARNGLADLNDEYKTANRELIEYSTAQTRYNQALARIGSAMQPTVTSIKNMQTLLMDGMLPAVENIGQAMSNKLASPAMQRKIENLGKNLGDVADALADFVIFLIENSDLVLSIIGSIGAGFLAWKITQILSSAITSFVNFVNTIKTGVAAINAVNLSTVIGALVGVGSLLIGLISNISKASAAAEDLKDKAETLRESTESLANEFQTTNQEFVINSERGKELAGTIQELDEKIKSGELSSRELATAQVELSTAVAQYNAIIGDTILTIDEQTGAVDGGTAALKDHTKQLLENAKAQAYVEQYAEAVKSASEAEVNQAEAIQILKDEYDDLTPKQQQYIDKVIDGTAKQSDLSALWRSSSILGDKYNGTVMAAVEALEDSTEARESAVNSMENLENAAESEGISLAGNTEEVDKQTQAIDMLSQKEAERLMQRVANNEEISASDQQALETWKANNAAYAEAYEEELAKQQEYQQRRLEILTNGNDAINYDDQISLEERLANYENNAQKMLEYENGLASLRKRAMSESNDDVKNAMLIYLDSLGDYSEESMGIINQLVTEYGEGGGDMFGALAEKYSEALGSEAPEILANTDAAMTEVGEKADKGISSGIDDSTASTDSGAEKVKEIASEMNDIVTDKDNFFAVGENIMLQIKNGMDSQINALYTMASNIANNLKRRLTIRGTVSATGSGNTANINVNWYAKGGIFNSPSVIGVGEAGPEAVIPLDKLETIISRTMNDRNTMSFQPVINITTQRVTDAEALRLSKIIGREFARLQGGRMS